MNRQGKGARRDLAKVKEWLTKASAQDNEDATIK
jgi:TPR repeat protein